MENIEFFAKMTLNEYHIKGAEEMRLK